MASLKEKRITAENLLCSYSEVYVRGVYSYEIISIHMLDYLWHIFKGTVHGSLSYVVPGLCARMPTKSIVVLYQLV